MPSSSDQTDPYRLITFLFQVETWMERALCRIERVPTDEFFPDRGASQDTAKEVCSRCEVTAECDAYARRTNSTYGIWGGEIRRRGTSATDGPASMRS